MFLAQCQLTNLAMAWEGRIAVFQLTILHSFPSITRFKQLAPSNPVTPHRIPLSLLGSTVCFASKARDRTQVIGAASLTNFEFLLIAWRMLVAKRIPKWKTGARPPPFWQISLAHASPLHKLFLTQDVYSLMRIDLVATELRTGGAERCLTEIALNLNARGDWVRVMSLGPLPKGNRDELVTRMFRAGIPVFSADATGALSLPRVVRTLSQWLQADPPDCLQTFLFHANVVGAMAARRAGVENHIGGVRVAQPHYARILLERRAAAGMKRLICVSEGVERFVRERWKVKPEIITTIPNGIAMDRFDKVSAMDWAQHGLSPGGPVMLFMGRFHKQKGIDLLLDVLPDLWMEYPELRCVFVGEGPYERRVRSFVNRAPAGFAACLPWQSQVEPLYAAADLIVVPSRFEGMPNVVLESMAAGKCVLAADVEGVGELLGPQAASQTFVPGDTTSLVRRLNEILRTNQFESLGVLNRQRAATEFTLENMVNRYRNEYQRIVEGA